MTAPPTRSLRELPPSLARNPVMTQWLSFVDGRVELRVGKVELGQGIVTALAQMAANELDVEPSRIDVLPVSTRYSPDEGRTTGSRSIEDSGEAVRQVCAEVRALFLAAAAEALALPREDLRIEDGRIVGPGSEATSYWELAASVSLDRQADGGVAPRALGTGVYTGRSVRRVDLDDKVRGAGRFIQNLVLPGMLHGRIVRPPSPSGRLIGVGAIQLRGARLVRDGSFLAVLADTEVGAIEAAKRVASAAGWECTSTLPEQHDLPAFMRVAPADDEVLSDFSPRGRALAVRGDTHAGGPHRAQYSRPFIAHASMGPSCAIALWEGNALRVWCSTQGVYDLRRELSRALALPVGRIEVEFLEGSGCYGHNGSDDAAYEAALLARHAEGRPVRLQWMREEELGWAPYGPAAVAELEATLDADGDILTWSHELWSYGSRGRPGYSSIGPAFWAASHLAEPFEREAAHLGGAIRN
ncbi:MAG: molybdopterin-dependent oxidoreductase, partial [Nitriliruptorales bacterium]|nr:molybdopterin-dependent oxidoreductase [Nitriliruptorales bacterium]